MGGAWLKVSRLLIVVAIMVVAGAGVSYAAGASTGQVAAGASTGQVAADASTGRVAADDTFDFKPVFPGIKQWVTLDEALDQYPPFLHVPNPEDPEQSGHVKGPNFALLVELLKTFVEYVQAFDGTKDKTYATLGDFRAAYIHDISKKVPWLSWQVEAFRMTAFSDLLRTRVDGGGAGIRIDLHPTPTGTLTMMVMPVYGERRSYGVPQSRQGGSDFIVRSSVGAAYSHKIGNRAEPGVKVFFQPQYVDVGQFRVYSELYVKVKLVDGSQNIGNQITVSEVAFVPKIIFWKSTDHAATFGTDIENMFGDAYYRLATHIYGFFNLEFRFQM